MLLQFMPLSQVGPQGPPQSLSVSQPFFTPSEQAGATQTDASQLQLSQSSSTLHEPASALEQPAHTPPPQSSPVSSPFTSRSTQNLQCPFPSHASPASAHPPSKSSPSGTKVHAPVPGAQNWQRPSHGTAQHTPPLHTPVLPGSTGAQSAFSMQDCPGSHREAQFGPPQLRSVSCPLISVSVQLA
ncbi:hypothetical protein BE21_52740 [Sorangium cellulosum]|uniref:Uncharacterized protein n=1 Tax=Sorangium cellulosum TaxID=56 RepID=A0A150TEV4_SORCE|nr:hypothetical protein BE21_52740 [Sorangium cellulosum]